MDVKWREMRSKVIFGHPKWPKSDFQNGRWRPFGKTNSPQKLRIDLKLREMRSKVIFGHPKNNVKKVCTIHKFVNNEPSTSYQIWLFIKKRKDSIDLSRFGPKIRPLVGIFTKKIHELSVYLKLRYISLRQRNY